MLFLSFVTAGLDLTWIALLGGMLAIPYYFWSDDAEATSSISRKDEVGPLLPSLMPPQYPPGLGLENSLQPKRGRRTNSNRRPGGPLRSNKLPHGINPKAAQDEQYRKWYNNYYFQQFKQHPPSVLPSNAIHRPTVIGLPPSGILQPHGHLNIVPTMHPLAQASGIANHHQHFRQNHVSHVFNGGTIGANNAAGYHHSSIDRNFNSANPSKGINIGLVPPPESVNDPNRIDTESIQESIESEKQSTVEEIQDSTAEGTVFAPNTAENIPRLPYQFDHHLPRPNSILKSSNEKIVKENNNLEENEFLSVPGLRNHENSFVNPQFQRLNIGQPIAHNPAPFRPTHIQNEAGLTLQAYNQHNILGLNPPRIDRVISGFGQENLPISPFSVTPGVQWQPYNNIGPLAQRQHLRGVHQHRGHQRFHRPGFPNAISNFNGIRGVPLGLQGSSLTTPLLPPPPPSKQLGSGEQRETFGSFRPEREGSSHFKVSFDENKFVVPSNEVSDVIENPTGDNSPEESLASPTVVFAHPNNVVKIEGEEGEILDLSKNAWQSQLPSNRLKVQIIQSQPQEQKTEKQLSQEVESLIRQSVEQQREQEKEQQLQEQLRELQKQRQEQIDQQQQQLRRQQEQSIKEQHSRAQQKHEQERQQAFLQHQKQQEILQKKQQEQKIQQIQHFQQQQIQKQQQQSPSEENSNVSYEPQPLSPFVFREDNGFIPIYGPPSAPSLFRQPVDRPEIPKPSAFLDKLLAEEKEKETSYEITFTKPIKLNKKKEVKKEKRPQPTCKYTDTTII